MLMKDKGVDFVAAVAVNFATTRGHRKNFPGPIHPQKLPQNINRKT